MPISSKLVGSPAPDFALDSNQGQRISLSDYKGIRSVVLVFLRGFR